MKKRTRAAIVEAASALLREGTMPTVADAAERGLVSRATAYRYFPTQESLLLEVAQLEPLVAPMEALIAAFTTEDAAQRLSQLVDTFVPVLLSNEVLFRTAVRAYMDTWLANQRTGEQLPLRSGRRLRWLDEVLKPVRGQLSDETWEQLRTGLALVMGAESLTVIEDVVGISEPEQISSHLNWAASAMLRAALEDAAKP